jgi:hypothetical protein
VTLVATTSTTNPQLPAMSALNFAEMRKDVLISLTAPFMVKNKLLDQDIFIKTV